ncbi:MAG TPA: hypothetical protein VK210_18915 [Terriglobia bacterium]|nr:hypothetical protein [Terriglobia bacterium]
MGRAFGFLSLIFVLGAGMYLYSKQVEEISPNGSTPKTTVSLTGVRNDLLAMANAEKRYWVSNAKYASLEELGKNSDIQVPQRPDFKYFIDANDSNFKIIATYSGADPHAPKRIAIDDTMSITTN